MFQRFRFYKIDILLWFITWLFFLKESIVETTGCSLFRLVQCGWSCNNTFENQFKGFAIGWSRTKKSVTPYHKPIYIIYIIFYVYYWEHVFSQYIIYIDTIFCTTAMMHRRSVKLSNLQVAALLTIGIPPIVSRGCMSWGLVYERPFYNSSSFNNEGFWYQESNWS